MVWDNGLHASVRLISGEFGDVREHTIRAFDASPAVLTIRNIIRELETGERTTGNIDVTMQSVEAQFGIAHSHLNGGARVSRCPWPTARFTSREVRRRLSRRR